MRDPPKVTGIGVTLLELLLWDGIERANRGVGEPRVAAVDPSILSDRQARAMDSDPSLAGSL